MHIHILGICGTFMGGVAVLAKDAGHTVTGCDANVYPPMSTQLEAQGIKLIEGFDPSQTDLNPDVYVIGNVVSRGNPLMEEILNKGLPYISGPQWLAENILHPQGEPSKWVLAVAGTHGKTTTSSMLAWILEHAGLAPGFLIGGVPQNFSVSARLPQTPKQDSKSKSPFFVIEADEYDTAFFDKRSKFVHYRPRTAILNNLEYDHADIFPDLAAIEAQFHHLLRTVPRNGLVLAPAQDEALARVLARGCYSNLITTGQTSGWHTRSAEATAFDVFKGEQLQGRVQWTLTGAHNQHNALVAILAAEHVGVSPAQSIEALSQFAGVKRRMEIRGTVNDVTVYDDFAHHPTAIQTTLEGLRAKVGSARILAVLEPRSNTMKLGTMAARLPAALTAADLVFCFGQTEGKQALGWDPAQVLAALGSRLQAHTQIDPLVRALAAQARSGDHIVVMSNGGFGSIHTKLLEALATTRV